MTQQTQSWFVYIVRCRDNSLYTGISNDVDARIVKHNAGDGAKYTRSRLPVSLVWKEKMPTVSAAKKKEAEVKKLTKTKKENLLFL